MYSIKILNKIKIRNAIEHHPIVHGSAQSKT